MYHIIYIIIDNIKSYLSTVNTSRANESPPTCTTGTCAW